MHNAEILILNVIKPIPVRTYGRFRDKRHHDQHETSMEMIRNRLEKFCKKSKEISVWDEKGRANRTCLLY